MERTRKLLQTLHRTHAGANQSGEDRPNFSELVTSIQQDASSKTPRKLASGAAAYAQGLQPLHGFLARHMECFRGKLGILVASTTFERFFDAVVTVSTVNLMVQADALARCDADNMLGPVRLAGSQAADAAAAELEDEDAAHECTLSWWMWSEVIFATLYCTEMFLKIGVYSWRDYIANGSNCYDCMITILTVLGQIFLSATRDPDAIDDGSGSWWSKLIRVVLLVRLGRVLRLTTTIRRFQLIFGTLARLIPAFSTLFLMVFTMMYLAGVIGVQLFGGAITRANPALWLNSTNPDGVAFATAGGMGYWANNFNDLPSAIVTLFELMVVNNWFVIMNGVAAATGKWARVYFIVYWVLAVLAVMNLVVAFVLDAFFEALSSSQQQEGEDERQPQPEPEPEPEPELEPELDTINERQPGAGSEGAAALDHQY
eukprot:SAG25_NODE_1417_length_3079_cov_3.434083_2_plen_430_part_00